MFRQVHCEHFFGFLRLIAVLRLIAESPEAVIVFRLKMAHGYHGQATEIASGAHTAVLKPNGSIAPRPSARKPALRHAQERQLTPSRGLDGTLQLDSKRTPRYRRQLFAKFP